MRALAITAAIYGNSALANASGFATTNGGTTGGAGGDIVYATTGTQIHQALCNRASSDTPIIIHVEGTINHGNTSKVSGDSCNTGPDLIELKEISNVSIIGVGSGAMFDQLGIHIRSSSNIIIQFLFISFMEDTGYMARTAFIVDKIMHKAGLHGKSFIPLLIGFGCNIPAIMATRSIEDRRNRLVTMMIIPFILGVAYLANPSCFAISARLLPFQKYWKMNFFSIPVSWA
ncbi:hypothetical protein LCGC14_2349540 [marine sediment metagenome]|uniref:Nucleoside transporter/FeoB GTPase Gate domain-containing protein n=1 Tax=marine sediment metagenome TaxID=412755 RepID=A0A0F9F4N7_9ZZZZ